MSYPQQNRRRRSQATNERTKDFCGIRNANRRDSVFCSCTASQPASSFLPSPSFLRDGGWLMKLQRPHSQYVMCVGGGEGKILHLPNDSIDITSRCRNNPIYPRIRWANWKEELNALLCMSSLRDKRKAAENYQYCTQSVNWGIIWLFKRGRDCPVFWAQLRIRRAAAKERITIQWVTEWTVRTTLIPCIYMDWSNVVHLPIYLLVERPTMEYIFLVSSESIIPIFYALLSMSCPCPIPSRCVPVLHNLFSFGHGRHRTLLEDW